MRSVRFAALAATSLWLTMAPAGVARLPEAPVIDRAEPDCQQIPPEVTPPLALEKTPLPLEVRVMVEREHLSLAREHMEVTRGAYERIGVRMKVRYDIVVPPAWPSGAFDQPSADEIFEFVKGHYGGKRPAGVDLVYFMTRYWSGGIADCIGGVRFPDQAFAIGSIDYSIEGAVPSPTGNEGVIAAHELGHLLGAHHHYSNCTEALPSGATRGDYNACTTMSPLATTASSTIGLLEASYIRHYAAEYARG